MKKILMVLTSHDQLGNTGKKTGFWLEEFAAPYYFFKDHGVAVTLASPKGGQAPIDPMSELPDFQTAATHRFNEDAAAKAELVQTQPLASVSHDDYDAVFYSGGYGPLWDLANDPTSIALIESFYANDKPVASVCHGPAVFRHPKDPQGQSLVAGKQVTAYSNSEEEIAQFTEIVPFSVEDMLKENGGQYSKGEDWHPYAKEDGLVITGQNPASSALVAELLWNKINS